MPVYLVKGPAGDRLVEAEQKTTAINHVIRDSVTAEPVSASELLVHMNNGMKVETAKRAEQPEAPVTRSADVQAMDKPAQGEEAAAE